MMKIVLILPRFRSRQWDSLSDQAWNIARELTADGRAQCCIAAGREDGEPALEVKNNVPIHRFMVERPRWSFLRKYFEFGDIPEDASVPGLELFLQKNRFDLAHIMVGGRFCGQMAAVLQARNIPYVVSCRSRDFRCFESSLCSSGLNRAAFGHYLRGFSGALKHADRVLCGDHRLRRVLAERFGDRKVECWLAGVETEKFARLPSVDFKGFYQIPAARQIVLTVGNVGEDGNQKLLLEALSMLNSRNWNCQLVVIGWCASERYMKSFRAMAAKCKVENYLTLIPGFQAGDERFAAAFQAASLVILPARYEVSASAVLEAWSAGVPVIASPAGSGGELIEDRVNGRLIEPGDFLACVSCCEELLNERNRSMLEKMRSAGRARARDFHLSVSLDKLMNIYRDVIGNKFNI